MRLKPILARFLGFGKKATAKQKTAVKAVSWATQESNL